MQGLEKGLRERLDGGPGRDCGRRLRRHGALRARQQPGAQGRLWRALDRRARAQGPCRDVQRPHRRRRVRRGEKVSGNGAAGMQGDTGRPAPSTARPACSDVRRAQLDAAVHRLPLWLASLAGRRCCSWASACVGTAARPSDLRSYRFSEGAPTPGPLAYRVAARGLVATPRAARRTRARSCRQGA
jgi:hypothetical protein